MVKEEIHRCWNDENDYIEIAKCLQNIVSSGFEKSAFNTKCRRHFQLIPLKQANYQ